MEVGDSIWLNTFQLEGRNFLSYPVAISSPI